MTTKTLDKESNIPRKSFTRALILTFDAGRFFLNLNTDKSDEITLNRVPSEKLFTFCLVIDGNKGKRKTHNTVLTD